MFKVRMSFVQTYYPILEFSKVFWILTLESFEWEQGVEINSWTIIINSISDCKRQTLSIEGIMPWIHLHVFFVEIIGVFYY